jgi:hypothetical protein
MRNVHTGHATVATNLPLQGLQTAPKCSNEGGRCLTSYLPVGLGPSFCSAFFFMAVVQAT